MSTISESDIHKIVQTVLLRMNVYPAQEATSRSQQSLEKESKTSAPFQPSNEKGRQVALGADHGGFELKENLKKYVEELGFSVIDCGPDNKNPVDYPDFAHAVAKLVSEGKVWRGIMIDGAGIGSCMVANKVPGVRAAMCHDHATAINSREHNNANVLTLGAGLIGQNLARQIVKIWLETEFGGGRHQARVAKIESVEKTYQKG